MQTEKYRPSFHFSPHTQWMNDPNGLVYHDGEYHLFYQYHPDSTIWGPMHWGHAISKDLYQWEDLPIALYPDELGYIFSGSIVVDEENTSNLQNGDGAVMIAVFTHHSDNKETQSIAYSNDKGRTWNKYKGNPVIDNPGLSDFRDPKVFWHASSRQWIMSLACGDHIQFYGSPNLLNWTFLSQFGKEFGAHGGVWECPDLISLFVEGEQEVKWVLIVSVNPGGPNGGSAVQYFTGHFDGEVFHCEDDKDSVKWADYGRDFYAAVTWSNSEEKWWIGWMNNWLYANEVPTYPFRGQMTLPRKLSLIKQNNTHYLLQTPLSIPRSDVYFEVDHIELTDESPYHFSLTDCTLLLKTKIKNCKAGALTFTLANRSKDFIKITAQQNNIIVDRENNSERDFSVDFLSKGQMKISKLDKLSLIIDRNSVELFINDGESVMTELFFLNDEELTLTVSANDYPIKLTEFQVRRVNSMYKII
ncbi:GH32 C-terminal domain-containing protein [Radiobacillus sp. PE A8.2]|uniref:GH32 C-terminal domain-containing protein n=1 Tax=Radiobacillus sp. PE A8.2 TaxID=3380349 RepID=UPI0038909C85